MRFTRVITLKDTFKPGTPSKETSNRDNDFAAPKYALTKHGDVLHIYEPESGEINVIPWSSVIGAMLDPTWENELKPVAVVAKGKR